MMKIAGIQKCSMVDYPGKICAVLFTSGCNMDCYYCHNRWLMNSETVNSHINESDILSFLRKRIKFLDGVVISGGEPTLQNDLISFISKIKSIGYDVKLDTNGTNYEVMKNLINSNLVDYVAMDLKAPYEKYNSYCGNKYNKDNIKKSINLLLEGKVEYEFRTTVLPQFDEPDIIEMAKQIQGARFYALQQYRPPESLTLFDDPRIKDTPHSAEWIKEMAESVKSYVCSCDTRGC
ncbi:MAG: anaerobic ribonucleoside-triphosphate reductase activating protein [Armatimonadota bacterium]